MDIKNITAKQHSCYLLSRIICHDVIPIAVYQSYDDLMYMHPYIKYALVGGTELPYQSVIDEHLDIHHFIDLYATVDGANYDYQIQKIDCYV